MRTCSDEIANKTNRQIRVVETRLTYRGPELDLSSNRSVLDMGMFLGFFVKRLIDAYRHAHEIHPQ